MPTPLPSFRQRLAPCYHPAVIHVRPLFVAPLLPLFAAIACGGDGAAAGIAGTSSGTTQPAGGSAGAAGGSAGGAGGASAGGGNGSGQPGALGQPGSAMSSGGVDPGTPHIAFYGRRDTRDARGPKFAFPSGRVVARFSGTSATVTLAHAVGYFGDVDCMWDVLVDGAPQAPLALRAGTSTKTLASGLAAGTHVVELYRRVESAYGATQILSLDFPGGTLLAPPPAPTRRVEFVADSQFEGYGVEATSPTDALCKPAPQPASHNARKSAMELVASKYGAELLATAYSGKGVEHNAAGPSDAVYWADIYGRSLGEDGASAWDFSRAPVDAVVLTIGGQDFDPDVVSQSVASEESSFGPRYTAFVNIVRAKNPSAQIFLTIGPQLKESYPAGLRSALRRVFGNVVTTRAQAGDAKVTVVEIPESTPGEETGCYQHGGIGLHQKMAATIEAAISQRLGW